MDTSRYTIPADIQAIVNTDKYVLNDIGMSDSEVRIYDKYVLKIRPYSNGRAGLLFMLHFKN